MRRGSPDPAAGLRQALEAAGVVIDTIDPVVPSLDDVFLDVVDRA